MNSLIALAAAAAYLDLGSSASLDDEDMEEEDLDGGEEAEEAPKPAKKKVKKGGKKVKKGAEKKASTKSDAKADKNVVRLKDLAKQAKLTEAVCRKKLREAEVPRGEGRWSWDLGSKSLKAARKALGLSVA